MAKKRKVTKKATKTKKQGLIWYKVETYGVKYNSLTFLLFLVFVLVVAMMLVSKTLGIGAY